MNTLEYLQNGVDSVENKINMIKRDISTSENRLVLLRINLIGEQDTLDHLKDTIAQLERQEQEG
jgi:hypothetical protein